MSFGQLAVKFFRFYGWEFDFKRHVVSVSEAARGKRLVKPTRPGREAISWQIRDPWEAEDNLAAGMTRFSRDLFINSFLAAEWASMTLADWQPVVCEEQVPDAPKRHSVK